MIYLHDVNCLLDMIMNIYELIGFDHEYLWVY